LRLERIDFFRSEVNARQLSYILNVKFRGTHDRVIITIKNREVQILLEPCADVGLTDGWDRWDLYDLYDLYDLCRSAKVRGSQVQNAGSRARGQSVRSQPIE
jgi:hypothetical protein